MRGFQLGAVSSEKRYSPAKAEIPGCVDVMEYFLDRLDTLNQRLKATDMVTEFTNRIKKSALSRSRPKALRQRLEQITAAAKMDGDGDLLRWV